MSVILQNFAKERMYKKTNISVLCTFTLNNHIAIYVYTACNNAVNPPTCINMKTHQFPEQDFSSNAH